MHNESARTTGLRTRSSLQGKAGCAAGRHSLLTRLARHTDRHRRRPASKGGSPGAGAHPEAHQRHRITAVLLGKPVVEASVQSPQSPQSSRWQRPACLPVPGAALCLPFCHCRIDQRILHSQAIAFANPVGIPNPPTSTRASARRGDPAGWPNVLTYGCTARGCGVVGGCCEACACRSSGYSTCWVGSGWVELRAVMC